MVIKSLNYNKELRNNNNKDNWDDSLKIPGKRNF